MPKCITWISLEVKVEHAQFPAIFSGISWLQVPFFSSWANPQICSSQLPVMGQTTRGEAVLGRPGSTCVTERLRYLHFLLTLEKKPTWNVSCNACGVSAIVPKDTGKKEKRNKPPNPLAHTAVGMSMSINKARGGPGAASRWAESSCRLRGLLGTRAVTKWEWKQIPCVRITASTEIGTRYALYEDATWFILQGMA